jgi:hypothetical protein
VVLFLNNTIACTIIPLKSASDWQRHNFFIVELPNFGLPLANPQFQ